MYYFVFILCIIAASILFIGFVLFFIGLLSRSRIVKTVSYFFFLFTAVVGLVAVVISVRFENFKKNQYVGVYELSEGGYQLVIESDNRFRMDSIPGLIPSGGGSYTIEEINNTIELSFDHGENIDCHEYVDSLSLIHI